MSMMEAEKLRQLEASGRQHEAAAVSPSRRRKGKRRGRRKSTANLNKELFGAGGGDDVEVTVVKEPVELTPAQVKMALKMKKRAERARQKRAARRASIAAEKLKVEGPETDHHGAYVDDKLEKKRQEELHVAFEEKKKKANAAKRASMARIKAHKDKLKKKAEEIAARDEAFRTRRVGN